MSDNWITLIPQDPLFVPPKANIARAVETLRGLLPLVEEIEVKIEETVVLFDAGANFSSISCPACSADIDMEWWQDRMDEDFHENGFMLKAYRLPCCEKMADLNTLQYNWEQGFAKFAIDLMNPQVSEFAEGPKSQIENILETKLRVIFQHL